MLSNQCEFLTILLKTMKQINYLAALAVTLLIGMLTSCAPKDDGPEEATLSLSATSVTIPNAGGEAQAITVTTNQVKWNAISNADWIKTTVSGNSLQIVAMPNEAGKDRAAQVLVVAGATSEKVEVIQTAADISLEVSPETIVVPNSGASKLISVKSNSGAWTLDIDEAAQAWIKQNVFNDMIELEIAANDGEPREAKLYAKSGTLQKEITVQQAGKGSEKFLIPYLVVEPEKRDLLTYEVNHGSILLRYAPKSSSLFDGDVPEHYEFVTSSQLLPSVIYLFNFKTDMLQGVEYVTKAESVKALVDEGFVDFLVKNNFADAKYDDKKDVITGESTENGFTVIALYDKDAKKVYIDFVAPKPKQPALQTFKAFPWDKKALLNNTEWTAAKIIKSEEDAGSTVTKNFMKKFPTVLESIRATLKKSTDRDIPSIRLYFMDVDDKTGTVNNDCTQQLLTVWADLSLAFWNNKGEIVMTKEFTKLYEDAGFVKIGNSSKGVGAYLYLEKEELVYLVRAIKFSDIPEFDIVVAMNIWHEHVDLDQSQANILKQLEKSYKATQLMDQKHNIKPF